MELADTVDLKSTAYYKRIGSSPISRTLESSCKYQHIKVNMRRSNKVPEWVLSEIVDMDCRGVNLFDWSEVKNFLSGEERFTMLDWIYENRSKFNMVVLNNTHIN